MKAKGDILDYGLFLDEMRLLRQQKEKCLCADFCIQLEKLSCEVAEAIYQNFGFKRVISDQTQHHKIISNYVVTLCLESIEEDLQRISSANYSLQDSLAEVLPILIDIADDLRTLAIAIRFTIDAESSGAHISTKRLYNKAANSIRQV